MATRTFRLTPTIASYLSVSELDPETGLFGPPCPAIFISREQGVKTGLRDRPLAEQDWPESLKREITRHFEYVFSLACETWKGPEPSPRAVYCNGLTPWVFKASDSEGQETPR